jgi:ATPase subunit of ABC transporter with duplicated ATPase domains
VTSHAVTPLWSDNPTANDLLGFADITAPILDAVRREKLDPVTVGIFGDWGSGKTTLLELLQDELDADDGVVVLFTRPWEYDPATDPKATLIAEVLGAVHAAAAQREGGVDTLSRELRDRFKSLARRVKWSKAITLAANSALSMGLPNIATYIQNPIRSERLISRSSWPW